MNGERMVFICVSAFQRSLINKWEVCSEAGMEGFGKHHLEQKWQGWPTLTLLNQSNLQNL